MALQEFDIANFSSFAGGSRDAFYGIYEEFSDQVYLYAHKLLGDPVEAQDVTANSFAKLWQERDRITSPLHMRRYLYKVAYNASLNIIRNKKLQNSLRKELPIPESIAEPPFDLEKLHSEVIAEIYGEVRKLPARAREAFLLTFAYGKTAREVAELMQIDVKTVYSQIQYALKSLRLALRDKGLETVYQCLILSLLVIYA